MIKNYISFLNILYKKPSKIMLGRWGNNNTKDSIIKNFYANHDNCGDIICKNPKIIKDMIKTEINKKN